MIDFISDNAGMIGLFFFMGFFLVMLIWLFRPGAGKLYKSYADMPLKEGQDDE
ncbi:MAG: cbb3-type cytochrome c oxidase subunit 3 [Rhodospirillales bacterium]|nr:cbb3-type cytochrome c oxidase subunit 3 [Rhodospirillales bacterium]MCB9980572.1 cbb3-type cytochrome c oxidase subunit 3 [Rhodospirillales bacterium]